MKKILFALFIVSQNAHAVVTRSCPVVFTGKISNVKLYSDEAIRAQADDWYNNEESVQEIFRIRDYHVNWLGTFVLIDRKDSRCHYASRTTASEITSKATFFTTGGKDYLRIDSVQLKERYGAKFRSFYFNINSYSATQFTNDGASILYGDSGLGHNGSIPYISIGRARNALLTVVL